MPLDTADTPLNAWVRALERTAPYASGEGLPLPALVAAQAERFGAQPALADDDVALSYADLAARTAQAARWALAQGLAAGETVALMLPNCAEYVPLWLGITAVRGVVALVNPALAGDALLHALTIAEPRHLIVAGAFEDSIAAIADRLPPGLVIWGFGPRATRPRMDLAAAALSAAPLGPAERRPPALGDLALLIYTSGTTGLPKAARVSHRRVAEWSAWFAGMIDTQPEDRMYNCLPMFHSVGGVVAIGAMLVGGGSVLIRPRFSAAKFWDEIAAGGCTVFQYIGELCRYLVNSPPHPLETAHRLRLCCGNGLRGDVWPAFTARFRIPRILEFYAATEGNVSLYNVQGKPGAIGHVPAFLAHRFPVALVRCDPDTRALLRGADGLCMRCGPDEVGEALGRIDHGADAHGRPFEGYADGRATEAKIARDVLAPGDAWFRTGDLMRRDRAGFYYFVDRLGDTFRWKGENVATEEVARALLACPGVAEAAVYGVAVPGAEGRAGMAMLGVTPNFDPAAFARDLATRLPHYARPVFLRIGATITYTGSFKPATAQLAREGYDPAEVKEALYVWDRAADGYVPLDAARHARLQDGDHRF